MRAVERIAAILGRAARGLAGHPPLPPAEDGPPPDADGRRGGDPANGRAVLEAKMVDGRGGAGPGSHA